MIRDAFDIAADLLDPPTSPARMLWEGLTCPNHPRCITEQWVPLPDTPEEVRERGVKLPCTKHARWNQLMPKGDWLTWYIRGGRGSGKTRPGAQALAALIEDQPGNDFACVGPTFGDARDTMLEGKSGLLAALGLPPNYSGWNRSEGKLFMPGGGRTFCDGANDGAYRIQGKNLAAIWADEVGLWVKWKVAWDESILGAVRIGENVRRIVTGTPKRGHPLVKRFIEDEHVVKSHLKTRDNIANLSTEAVEDLERQYAGTNLYAQELEGELLEEAEGALWTLDEAIAKLKGKGLIRYGKPPTTVVRIGGHSIEQADFLYLVIAVDPAISSSGDEWGIIAVGLATDGKIYVRADYSAQCSPEEAAKRIVGAYHDQEASRIVYESNQGGEMVKLIIDGIERNLPVTGVRAYQGKVLRADPVQHAYQQGRVLHEQPLSLLETQMVGWEPLAGMPSPDRVDALVHGIRDIDARSNAEVRAFPHPLG